MYNKSVLLGTDAEAISILLKIHAYVNPLILDVTYNTGKIWKGLPCKLVKMDISGDLENLDIIADFKQIPFKDECFDVIVFDPPHLPTNAASANSSKIWEKQYGLTNEGFGREGDNVCGMFLPFLLEAKRVLKKNGIILAKIADIVHNHKYQWQQVYYIIECINVGLTPCDMLIKCDPKGGNLKSSKWKNVKHLKRSHAYWVVTRKGKCEKP